MSRRLLLLMVCALFAVACVSKTRGAVRNETAAPISVVLKTADGKTHAFADVAPNTTTSFAELAFEGFKAVTIEVTKGTAQGGSLDLKKTYDNVVVVKEGAAPSLDAQENDDNTFW